MGGVTTNSLSLFSSGASSQAADRRGGNSQVAASSSGYGNSIGPIAPASLAQLHRAKLRTGKEVSLKLQRDQLKCFYRMYRLTDLGEDRLWELLTTKVVGYPDYFDFQLCRVISALHGDPHWGNMYFMEPREWRSSL